MLAGQQYASVDVRVYDDGMFAGQQHASVDVRVYDDRMLAGQQYTSVDVRVYDDGIPEENEKFRLKLKKAENAMVGSDDKTVVQIVNHSDGTAIQ